MTAQSTFTFKARDASGEIITGQVSASSAGEVGARLRAEGKFVLAIEDGAMRGGAELNREQLRRSEAAKRVRREDVIGFCQQLSVMLETGVPIAEALDAFCAQARRREFSVVLGSLRADICAGEPLSLAMAKWPRVFPSMVVSLMKASEASGTMSMMLGRVGDYLSKERRAARQIKGALAYPGFMMLAGLVMTGFLMAFVLPRFAKIYEARSATLPRPTKILLSVSDFVVHEYLLYGPVVAIASIACFFWMRHASGRRFRDWCKLHLPVLRGMFSQLYITRASRTMATLLAAGVNVLDIIDICRGVTNNVYYDVLWRDMERGIRDGRQISDAVVNSRLIPSNVASMIVSGERSGRLANVMERIAEFSEQELDNAVKHATSFIEPVMIMFMGIVVGGVAMALLLPIFSMSKVVSGG
jgi:type IV pilus assembly protein PilC